MFKPFASLSALAVAAISLLQVRPADACSSTRCPQPELLPANDATVPQNVPGFPFRVWSSAPPDAQAVSLKDAAGAEIAATVQSGTSGSRHLVVPASPLAPGHYSVEVTSSCGAGNTSKETRSFTVVEPQPFPTELGKLRAVRSAPGTVIVPAGPRCTLTAPADRVSIEIDPSPSFASFRSVAIFSTFVDGTPWKGPVVNYDGVGLPRSFDPLQVYARCDGQSDGGAAGATLGKHTVEVRAQIEGAPTQPAPASIEIDLDCSPPGATPAAETESGCASAPLHGETTPAAIAGGLVIAAGALVRRALRRRR